MLRLFSSFRRQWILSVLSAACCLGLAGCTQILLTGAYFLKGMETDPEFEGLKGKKTAVVCRPLVELQYSGTDAATMLAREVGRRMVERGKKIHVVPAQTVEEWTDEHDWEKFAEVGRALKSDYVVGIELEEFSMYQGQTLYQGRATVNVTLHDMKDAGKTVYEKRLDRIVYPVNSGVSTSDKTEEQFRREFTAVVAERIGRSFYAFDHRDDGALDSRVLD